MPKHPASTLVFVVTFVSPYCKIVFTNESGFRGKNWQEFGWHSVEGHATVDASADPLSFNARQAIQLLRTFGTEGETADRFGFVLEGSVFVD
jgi:hypothetical protein